MKRFLLTFFFVALILFARLPHPLLHPALFAEDGNIFFKEQYESGLFKSFFVNYAGYAHGTARIIAWGCSFVPLEHIPFAYALVSLIIASISFSLLSLPAFRQLIESDDIRSLCCMLFAIMPNAESLMKVAYIDWYILFAFLLLLLIDLPSSKWWLLPFAILVTWTSPVAIVTTPIVLYRLFVGKDMAEKIWWGIVQISLISYLLHSESPPHSLRLLVQDHNWVISLLDSFWYRVVFFFTAGDYFAEPPFIQSWNIVRIAGVGGLVLFGPALYFLSDKLTRPTLILSYLIVATSCLYILRPDSWNFYIDWTSHAWAGDGRHFYCSILLLCVVLGIVCDRLRLFERKKFQLAFALWVCCHLVHFRLFEWHSPVPWSEVAMHIKTAQKRPGLHDVPVPISPQSFDFVLHVNSDQHETELAAR